MNAKSGLDGFFNPTTPVSEQKIIIILGHSSRRVKEIEEYLE